MVLRDTGPVEEARLTLDEAMPPAPETGQVLVRILANAVCRTDLHIIEGELPAALPRVLGHQAVGVVEELGPATSGVAVGERVGVGWLATTCGSCGYCTNGRENLCTSPRFTGRDVDGGYAHYLVADARFAYPIPARYGNVEASPLLCAGIIGYRALKLSEVRMEGKVGLFGFGASAHLVIQAASAWGCSTYVFTREATHQEHARALGAVWAGGLDDDPGVLLDSAISFAPAGEVVLMALSRLDRGGTLAINAVHASDIPRLPYEQLYWERTIRSVTNYTRADATDFLEFAAHNDIRVDTEAFPLEAANEALMQLKHGAIRGAAVLVT
jgi:propanol-preferring alcohol dehydrogenase